MKKVIEAGIANARRREVYSIWHSALIAPIR